MRIRFDITSKDSRIVFILKSIYLVPIILIIWLPAALYFGLKEIGNIFEGTVENFKERKWF